MKKIILGLAIAMLATSPVLAGWSKDKRIDVRRVENLPYNILKSDFKVTGFSMSDETISFYECGNVETGESLYNSQTVSREFGIGPNEIYATKVVSKYKRDVGINGDFYAQGVSSEINVDFDGVLNPIEGEDGIEFPDHNGFGTYSLISMGYNTSVFQTITPYVLDEVFRDDIIIIIPQKL